MGTTLTGLTPATTYDALIKVGDNGPLSATAKYVGDGLGNDSVVALSTSSVGIGTTSPTQLLHVAGNVRITGALYDGNNAAGTSGQILSSTGTGTDWIDVSSLGVVDGSGTANYVSKWSDPNTLTNSLIYDNGSAVGIGTTSNSYTAAGRGNLNIAGSAGAILGFQIGGAAKGYVFHDNTNLQLWNEVAGDLLFGANATERMRITADGNVGIGTSSPAQKLTVYRNDAGNVSALIENAFINQGNLIQFNQNTTSGTVTAYIGHGGDATGNLRFFNGGAERVSITTAGNVGIGTSSPAAKLHVDGAFGTSSGAYISGSTYGMLGVNRGASNASAGVQYYNIGSQKWFAGIYENTDNFGFYSVGTSSFPMVIEYSTGNVGIGTSSPQARLEVASGSPTSAEVQRWSYNTANPDFSLRLRQDVTTGLVKHVFDLVNNSTTYANNLVLTNGNVGIGTSSPQKPLEVITSAADFASVGVNTISIGEWTGIHFGYRENSTSYRKSAIVFQRTGSAAEGDIHFLNNNTANSSSATLSDSKMVITSAGDVSITTGNIALSGAGGIYFDNAGSKYLDDYEVGTWTMGVSFGGGTTGITYSANTGTYTKIGRQVTVNGLIVLTSKGSSTGVARITGLPFTIGTGNSFQSLAPIHFENISFTGQLQPIGAVGDTVIVIQYVTEAGVNNNASEANFTDTARISINFTYFV